MSIRKIPVSHLRRMRFSKIACFWSLGLFDHGAFLAGGSLRTLISDEEVSDFDVFFSWLSPIITPENQNPCLEIPLGTATPEIPRYSNVEAIKRKLEKEKFKLIFSCPEGKMFSYKKGDMKIQLILEITDRPQQIIEQFDFNACCAAFDGEFFYYSKEFIRDVKTKKLSINQITYPVATIKRMVKYAAKGYNINGACFQFMTQTSGAIFDGEQLRLYID